MKFAIRLIPRLSPWLLLAVFLVAVPAAVAEAAAPAETSGRVGADEIRARIESLQSRTDVVAAEKQLTLENLQEALARTESAQAARKLAAQYADSLGQAPAIIDQLRAELAKPREAAASTAAAPIDPAEAQLQIAALQVEAVRLRTRQRELEDSLRTMAQRQTGARQELSDLRKQLERRGDILPVGASSLLQDSARIKDDAVRQDLSARIATAEQELLSLPTREAIAAARLGVLGRKLGEVEAAVSDLGRRIDAQEQDDVRAKLERAEEAVRNLAGQPEAVVALAEETAALRKSMFEVANNLRTLWPIKDRLYGQLQEITAAHKNAEQILALGRVGEEYGRLLREVAKKLPSAASLRNQIAEHRDELAVARVGRFRSEQKLGEVETGVQAAKRFIESRRLDAGKPMQSTVQALLKSRREALSDLQVIQGRQVEALGELNQLESELLQRSVQLRAMLDQRLLWLPSSPPIGAGWGRQLLTPLATYFSAANRAELLPAVRATLAARALWTSALVAACFALLVFRKRLIRALTDLARPVGTRADSLAPTLLALLVTVLLALPFALAFGIIGSLFLQPNRPASFADAIAAGFIGVAIVVFILELFRNMCRHNGLFVAHFGWDAQASRRLGLALWNLALVLAPAAWLSGFARTSGDPGMQDGIGRLGLLVSSLALAVFTWRLFRPVGGAMTGSLQRKGLLWRTRVVWFHALLAAPLVLAVLAVIGYSVSAEELQARMVTSGWLLLAIIIAFHIAMRGVLVVGRRAAIRQAEARSARLAEEREAAALGDGGSEAAPIRHEEPEIDVVTVSQQTRAMLSAAGGVLFVVMLWQIWSGLVPALGIFNDVVVWSSVSTTSSGQVVSAVTLGHLLLSLVVLVLTFLAARNLPGFLEVVVLHRFEIDSGTRYAYVTICRYGILAVGLGLAFSRIGVDWSKLQWIIAALGVGLGFGLQEIVANFVSGIIILFERPVRVGDLITIDDTVGTVTRIKIRAITITDPDNFEVVVPNKAFITGTVKNWSLTSPITRLVVKVGIAYGSDVALAQKTLLEIAAAEENVLETPAPTVLFLGFGDSSLDLELRVFVGRIEHRLPTLHHLHSAVHAGFANAGIEIPFPQRDIHVRPQAETASGAQGRDDPPAGKP